MNSNLDFSTFTQIFYSCLPLDENIFSLPLYNYLTDALDGLLINTNGGFSRPKLLLWHSVSSTLKGAVLKKIT